MIRSGIFVACAAGLAALIVGLRFGLEGGLETFALLLALGGLALLAAHAAAEHRRRLGPLSRQFGLGVALAAGQMVVAVVVFAALMFVSSHDALLVSVIVAFAALIAIRATALLVGSVVSDVEAMRDGLRAVGEGGSASPLVLTSRDELAQLAEEANTMMGRLAAEEAARNGAEGARRDLIAAVSHDLRTPITSLRLLAEAVGDDIVDAETRRRYLDDMTTHIRALAALIDDLFELSRLEAGEIGWSVEQVCLEELVGETVAAMRVQAAAKNVAVIAELPAELAPATANPEKVQRVLFNLIQNAIRHTPADGSVTVRAEARGDAVEIEVADTGEGIAVSDRGRVFDPFYRGGSEAARTRKGAGLGLAISRAIVEAHGGRIWLEDSGRGTRVRFSLPRPSVPPGVPA